MSITKTGIMVDTSSSFSNPRRIEVEGVQSTIQATGLNPHTTYYVKGYVIDNGVEIVSNNSMSFETLADYQPITFTNVSGTTNTLTIENVFHQEYTWIEYSTDDGSTWTQWISTSDLSISIPAGDNVKFRSYRPVGITDTYIFSSTGDISVSGETGSLSTHCCRMFKDWTNLVDASGLILTPDYYNSNWSQMFEGCTRLVSGPREIPSDLGREMYPNDISLACGSMFKDCTSLVNAPALPATRLVSTCYRQMFSGCTSLTTAPALPATTLPPASYAANGCYYRMFEGCTSLTTAPALPATTLTTGCYGQMFEGCTSLTTTPALPATTLADWCYERMFSGCTSLTTTPALPATTLTEGCYEALFENCTSLTTAPALPATTLANASYAGMFSGCTSLTTAPALPATEAPTHVYKYMFKNCTSLREMPYIAAVKVDWWSMTGMFYGCTSLVRTTDLFTNNMATYCYMQMFFGCTALEESPIIKAINIADTACFASMFKGCSRLRKITTYITNWDYQNFSNWVEGVSQNGSFYNLGRATIPSGVSGIPSGWTEINSI